MNHGSESELLGRRGVAFTQNGLVEFDQIPSTAITLDCSICGGKSLPAETTFQTPLHQNGARMETANGRTANGREKTNGVTGAHVNNLKKEEAPHETTSEICSPSVVKSVPPKPPGWADWTVLVSFCIPCTQHTN